MTNRIKVDTVRELTGSMTLTLHEVSTDESASASIGGPPVTVTVGTPGQLAAVTFAGTAGQRVGITLSGVTISSSNVSLLNPDGSLLLNPSLMTTSGKFLDATLASTGTHMVRIDPVGTAVGSATASLVIVPADLVSTITVGGLPVTVSIPTAGQNARLSFTGSQGQRVTLQITGVTISSSVVSIRKPEDSVLASAPVTTSGGFIDTNELPTSGTYAVYIDPNGAATGDITVTAYDVPADLAGPITADGTPVTVAIGNIGQNATLSFTGSVGQRISLRAANVTASSFAISIVRPTGSTLASVTVGTAGGFIDTRVLSDAGTFTIRVDPVSTTTGSLSLTLYTLPVDAAATATVGGAGVPVVIGTPGQGGTVTFDGTVSQQVTVRVTGNTMGSVTVRVLRPDNTQLTSLTSSLAAFNLSTQTLPITGPYRVTIDPASTNTGTLTVQVTTP